MRYEKGNSEFITLTIDQFDWVRALYNFNLDRKAFYFTKMLFTIIYNFIPHEAIASHIKDANWVNKQIKKLIVETNHIVLLTETLYILYNIV